MGLNQKSLSFETAIPFRAAKVVQAERNAKQKTKFFAFIPEAQPIFAKQSSASRGKHKDKEGVCFLFLHKDMLANRW